MSVATLLALAAVGTKSGGSAPDIRDIRGPIPIPAIWPTALLVAAALALVVVLGAVAYAAIRRTRRARVKTPAQIALERLGIARGTANEARAAELGETISGTVREYIEARFDLRAPKLTTEEFLHDLLSTEQSPVAQHRDELAEFLVACDLAKFARFTIDVEHQLAMIVAAEGFVRATDAAEATATAALPSRTPAILEART